MKIKQLWEEIVEFYYEVTTEILVGIMTWSASKLYKFVHLKTETIEGIDYVIEVTFSNIK